MSLATVSGFHLLYYSRDVATLSAGSLLIIRLGLFSLPVDDFQLPKETRDLHFTPKGWKAYIERFWSDDARLRGFPKPSEL
jgi:hypothetical protein